MADIIEIEFPQKSYVINTVPSLSITPKKIPNRKVVTDLVLKCSVTRNATLAQQMQRLDDFMQGKGTDQYSNIPNDFVIACFDHPSLVGAVPIRQIAIFGAIPKNLKLASADANYSQGGVPLDELTFSVDDLKVL